MIEYLAPGFVYSLLKDVWAKIGPTRRKLSPSQVVELRKKWKAEIEPHIFANYRAKLRQDVIIRDMRRIDNYPGVEDRKGISPWFRAQLEHFHYWRRYPEFAR